MTVSLRVMSAGNGYEYLLRSVVGGDGNRSLGTPLTRYYLEEGTPPGFWMGSGVAAFGNGEIAAGDVVTPEHLVRLLGHGLDPTNPDVALGRPYQQFSAPSERIEARVAKLPESLSAGERADAVATITVEEEKQGTRAAVAGYDLTFSVSKSVSVLWAVTDADTQARIADVHHATVADVLALFERDVAATRTGSHSINQEPSSASPPRRSTTTTPGRTTHSCTRTSSSPTRSRPSATVSGAAWTGGRSTRRPLR